MKIAVIFDADLNDRKGQFNAIVNRTKQLISFTDCTVDIYCFQDRPGGLNRLFRAVEKKVYTNELTIDGLKLNVIWYRRYLTDDILSSRLHRPPFLFRKWLRYIISTFSTYDIITAHGLNCGEVARRVNKEYGIPYYVTWHGTDIHTTPFLSSSLRQYVATILQGAECNFFVSEALMNTAKSFAQGFKGEVLFNGVSELFKKYDDNKRLTLKEKYGVAKTKVVAFVGNLVPVKNVVSLPDIFNEVKQNYEGSITFWIIGDGFQHKLIEDAMKEKGINCIYWGNMPASELPDMMNCVDILVLPSKNESFGLVLVEAIACGANAVGSNRGGIPEVIGKENAFELNNDFISNISKRIVYLLTHNVKQDVKKEFDWKVTAKKEYSIYCQGNHNNG